MLLLLIKSTYLRQSCCFKYKLKRTICKQMMKHCRIRSPEHWTKNSIPYHKNFFKGKATSKRKASFLNRIRSICVYTDNESMPNQVTRVMTWKFNIRSLMKQCQSDSCFKWTEQLLLETLGSIATTHTPREIVILLNDITSILTCH